MAIRQESLRHKEAFEFYYSLGSSRTLDKVREEFKVSKTSVKAWSTKFKWQKRIKQRDNENAILLQEKTNSAIVDEKANYREIIKLAFDVFTENLHAGLIDIKTVQDAERLIKLDLLILGEPTERTKVDGGHQIYNITQQLIKDPESLELANRLLQRSRGITNIDTSQPSSDDIERALESLRPPDPVEQEIGGGCNRKD